MKKNKYRIKLNLTQQLLVIVLSFVVILSLFFFGFMNQSVSKMVEQQMYNIVHSSQEDIIYAFRNEEKLDDVVKSGNYFVGHIIYEDDTISHRYLNDTISDDLLNEVYTNYNNQRMPRVDYIYKNSDSAIYYTISKISEKYWIISLIYDTYRNQFQTVLVNSIINITVTVIIAIFVVILVWIGSIINPLNSIKEFIENKKKGHTINLSIKRSDEIGEVAQALVDMTKEIESQEKVKEEMIHNISHDLKTPIAVIKSYGESIKDGIYPYDTLEKSVDVILDNADRLEKKVYSLLFLNRLEYIKENVSGQKTNISEVVNRVVTSMKVIRPEIIFEVNGNENVYFDGEEEPWRVVIENLVENGLRYCKSTIKFNIDTNCLTVYNDGPKIPETNIESIFKPYEKGVKGKFGLGLSIVSKVSTIYGYQVKAMNKSRGVEFVIYKQVIEETKKKTKNRRYKRK